MSIEIQQNRRFLNKSNEELLKEYKQENSLEIKQELALRYLYVIKSAAIRMRDVYLSFAQMEDIIHEGVIMLMSAIDKFEVDRNVKFETYIAKRIRGMIIDLARKQDWAPRSARRNAKRIKEAFDLLATNLGRSPEEKEIADYLELPMEKYQEVHSKTNLFSVLSLDMILDDTGENSARTAIPSPIASEQPEESYLDAEMKAILTDGIRQLKEKEQLVVSLYYMEELNMKQIAEVIEVSEPRVSQIHANAINKLKEYIEQQMQPANGGKGE